MSPFDFDTDDIDAPQDIDLEYGRGEEYDIDCPACGKPIHEDADLCPHCGQWMFTESPAAQRSRKWFWPVMVAVLIALILVMWHGLRL